MFAHTPVVIRAPYMHLKLHKTMLKNIGIHLLKLLVLTILTVIKLYTL